MSDEVEGLRGSVVYDIDKVRNTLLSEMSYSYLQGCEYGTEYPAEYRNVQGFNANSPLGYCSAKRDTDYVDYMLEQAAAIGRK